MQNSIIEIMSTNLETIEIQENAQDAAKKMNDKRISSVLVVDRTKSDEQERSLWG